MFAEHGTLKAENENIKTLHLCCNLNCIAKVQGILIAWKR